MAAFRLWEMAEHLPPLALPFEPEQAWRKRRRRDHKLAHTEGERMRSRKCG
jgi:hypothetical protein